MMETHRGGSGARVIMVGHSFGGLLMERALTQALADFVLRQRTDLRSGGSASLARMGVSAVGITPEIRNAFKLGNGGGVLVGEVETESPAARVDIRAGDVITSVDGQPVTNSVDLKRRLALASRRGAVPLELMRNGESRTVVVTDGGDGAWADLAVFVNSAAAASEGKQMLDLLKGLEYSVPRQTARSDQLHRPAERPLLLSISSLGDAATRFALPIGHGPSYLNQKLNGGWRTYEVPKPEAGSAPPAPESLPPVPSQSSYYLSTTAHLEALQSHLIVGPNDVSRCQAPNKAAVVFGTPFALLGQQLWFSQNQSGASDPVSRCFWAAHIVRMKLLHG